MEPEKPNWNIQFKDFPPIPKPKQWDENGSTQEQIITNKIFQGEQITDSEKEILKNCIKYYNEVIPKFKSLDYSKLSDREIKEFVTFLDYVFSYITLHSNDLYIPRLYRLVNNESVREKGRIRYQKHLTYPPKDLVKKTNKYNRSNTPDFNLFYATDSIDNALLEIKPDVDSLVSIGVWIPKTGSEVKVVSYPVSHNPLLININPQVRKGFFVIQELKKKQKEPLIIDFMGVMFKFLSEEFAKPVKNHIEYLISARFSEKIFDREPGPDQHFNYDCIIYPSVGNQYQVENVALKPDIIDDKFKLEKVIEFKITKTFYDKIPPRNTQEEITVIECKDKEETDWIEKDGYIVW